MLVLIAGGAGFIGRHICEPFQDRVEVRVLDNLRCGLRNNLSGLECEPIVGTILDRELVREAMKGVDVVFHLAAMVTVPGSVQKPNEYAEIDTRGTAIVAARYCEQQLSFQERHSRHLQSRHL
jgi:nucleoside-diphosphate-sugar epimerase